MTALPAGAIDCDIHPSVPSVQALMPYLEDHWREQVVIRGIDELNSISYPLNSPLTCRADWRPASGRPAGARPAAELSWAGPDPRPVFYPPPHRRKRKIF